MVEASQILQAGSVAELVLILHREKHQLAVPTPPSFHQGRVQLQPQLGQLEYLILKGPGVGQREHRRSSQLLTENGDGSMGSAHLGLHHGRSLCPQHLHRLKDVHHALVSHPLQDDAEGDEDSGSADTRAVKQSKEVQRDRLLRVVMLGGGGGGCPVAAAAAFPSC